MIILAICLTLAAVIDIIASAVELIKERKVVKMAWKHNKKQFNKVILEVISDIAAAIIFIAYIVEVTK